AVSVASALDRETQASLTLTIQATDGPGLTSTGSQQLAVTLTDVNDNPPEFPTAHFTIDIYEGTASPSTLITFTNPSVVKDADVGANAYVNVSLASGVKPPSGPILRAASFAMVVIVGVRSAELPVVRGGELVELLQSHPVVETLALTESARVVRPVPVEADGAVDSVLEGRPALHRLPHLQWAMGCCISCTQIDAVLHFVVQKPQRKAQVTHPQLRQAGVAGVPALPAGVHRSPIAGQQRAGARGRVEADGFRVLSRSHAVNVVDRQLHRQHPVLGEVASLETPAGLLGRGSRCHDSADDEQRKHSPLNEFVMSGSALQTNRVFSRASDPAQYVLVVKAQDYGLPSLSASSTVTVNILEANLAAPKFPVTDLTISVPENAAIGSLLYFANATDTDFGRGGKVAYHLASVSPPPSVTPPYFQLDNATGMLFLQSALDYDSLSTRGPYTLTILAYDFGNASRSGSQTLTISVTDYNDNDPQFAASNTFSKSLTENVGSGYAVTTVTYTDADSGLNAEVRCSIVAQTSPSVFGINDTTCLMFTTANPDREVREVREVTVRLTDRGTPSRYKEATFTVTLLDLNDNVPQFPDSRIVASVVEEASAPVTVTTVTATDADSGVNAKISYSLRSADGTSDASKFAVDSAGKVTTTAPLDREAARGDFYALLLLAVDQGSPALTGTCLLNITVTDTNDNSPVWVSAPYSATVSEAARLGTLVKQVQATDKDSVFGQVTYRIIAGNTLSLFRIGNTTGTVETAQNSGLDRETVPLWTLTLEAADNGLPAKSVTTTLTVTVADVNEFAPAWVNASYNVAVYENVPAGTLVSSPLVATDADAGPLNNQVNYAVDAVLQGEFYFNIGNSTAQLFVSTAKLDRETRDVYYYRIRAWDSAEVPKTCTPCLTVTINILDVNDNDPVFNQTMYNSSLYENASIGTNVLSVWGSDRDIGENGNIRYYINSTGAEGFNASEVFSLDPVSGLLTVRAGLDRETKASYSFPIIIRDNGTAPQRSSSATVFITILDVNDVAPSFSSGFYNFEVPQVDDGNMLIGQLSATDPDLGDGGVV
uniref:Cadherin domain-containing protein n=1 Tax=Macrostomum lignano TaxID=282301 RepID=A0A1I8HBX7_9PLAT